MNPLIVKMREMLARNNSTANGHVVAALYKFVTIDDVELLRQHLQSLCEANRIFGTLLVADEGINGTVSGPSEGMIAFLDWLHADRRFDELSLKFSYSPKQPFLRMKVRLKREIVTMGCPEISPAKQTGTYVEPKDWNGLLADPDVMLIDTRNTYETAIGMFQGAVDPMTQNFRDFPEWAHSLANQPAERRPKKIAMYCTGGIRCEKASALMQDLGFDEVYHLKGGILQYLEDVPAQDSIWNGQCFVFDGRVAVNHDLEPGSYDMCHACRMPITVEDIEHPDFQPGISCPHCRPTLDPKRAARFAERQKQIELASARGESHLGVNQRTTDRKAEPQARLKR